MTEARVGTIIHGAIGDCYEQLSAIKILRTSQPGKKWIGFFAVKNRLHAMSHYRLDMLDEVYTAENIESIPVDYFYQFQLNDTELQRDIILKLPSAIRSKFIVNKKPWHIIREHDYTHSGLELSLSDSGKDYVPQCMAANGIHADIYKNHFTVGYLWRYRQPNTQDAIKPYFQKPPNWIIRTKSDLFNWMIKNLNAYIIVAGMNKQSGTHSTVNTSLLEKGAFVKGDYNSKFTDLTMDIPSDRCVYMKGLGYAAELEIMSRCDIVFAMPSGFSEALWMKRKTPVILVDAPPVYIAKLLWNKMPLFNNTKLRYLLFNAFTSHTRSNVLRFAEKEKFLSFH